MHFIQINKKNIKIEFEFETTSKINIKKNKIFY